MRKLGVLATEVEAQVAFHDVDLAGVVWHGHYVKYLENARWALMDRIDYGLEQMIASGYGWPVVDLQVKYLRYRRFRDRIRVRASLIEWEDKLTINYLVSDSSNDQRVARARTVQVAVDIATGALQFASPTVLVDRVRRAMEPS